MSQRPPWSSWASRTPTSPTRGRRPIGSRPGRTSRHGARGRALPAVAAVRHHHRRSPALPGIGHGPCLGRPASPSRLVVTSGASFPSGHAIAASVTVVAAVIALIPAGKRRTWWGAAAVAFSIVMGLSRAYLAAHWLSDATAGILLGTSCALVTALVADQFQRHRNRLQRPAGTQFLAGVPPAHNAEDNR
jgi:membrane-associated phospholipid phosphatase